ncbi:MAG: CoA-binding protein [Candidatus Lokiarchaeota archaeon]|nr:CoA-binding protein [Candidatus Lokiarchaeota archaeon]
MEQINYFEKLFYPKTIAFIGASKRREWQLTGYVDRGFQGKLYFVSKGNDKIFNIDCLRDVNDLPDGIDHTIIAVNRDQLVEIVKKCIKKNFATIHIFSAGTGEWDEEGRKIEEEIYELLKNSSTRAIGPNCMGLYSTGGRYTFNPSFKADPVGNVAIISQSGDLTERFVQNLNSLGVDFLVGASIGNSISINVTDLIQYFNADSRIEIISVYFEGFSRYHHIEGRRLYNVLKETKKPVIFLRTGKTDAGKRSAKSHTGSLTTSNQIWNAVFSQTNAIQVRTFEELVETTLAFNHYKDLLPNEKGVLLITWSGGNATIATDLITQLGVTVPEFSDSTKVKLKSLIRFGGVVNPLDLPWKNFSDEYSKIAEIAIKEPYIGGVLAESYQPFDENSRDNYFENLLFLKHLCHEQRKPLFLSLPFTNFLNRQKYRNRIIDMGVPIFKSFESAAKAFLNLYLYKTKLKNKTE